MDDVVDLRKSKIWVAGHTGLVGSALVKNLRSRGITPLTVTHKDLDLCRQQDVENWMRKHEPDFIILAAARVGGIAANAAKPADFMYENLAIAQNVIYQAAQQNIKKLIFLGSSCIYPKYAPQPLQESSLLTSALEQTNEAYALAKIAGLKLCEYYRRQYGHDFISVMPCNLYGPGDRWDEAAGHVIPSLISRFHDAKINSKDQVVVWGSGTPLREFLYSDDLACALLKILEAPSSHDIINIGSGEEITIAQLSGAIARTVGYEGQIVFDTTKPDGTPRKIMDSSRIRQLGWKKIMNFEEGLRYAYEDFIGSLSKSSRIATSN